jgi:hypothetical protein
MEFFYINGHDSPTAVISATVFLFLRQTYLNVQLVMPLTRRMLQAAARERQLQRYAAALINDLAQANKLNVPSRGRVNWTFCCQLICEDLMRNMLLPTVVLRFNGYGM